MNNSDQMNLLYDPELTYFAAARCCVAEFLDSVLLFPCRALRVHGFFCLRCGSGAGIFLQDPFAVNMYELDDFGSDLLKRLIFRSSSSTIRIGSRWAKRFNILLLLYKI